MDAKELLKILKSSLNKGFQLEQRKDNLYQLFAPFFHPDGDMIDIFIKTNPDDDTYLEVCDCGLTLMRLSYEYDIDTPNKQNLLDSIILENNAHLSKGNISLKTNPEFLFMSILQMTQIVTKVMSMKILQRDLVTTLFFDQLKDFVAIKLNGYNPISDFHPLQDRDDLTVDYCFKPAQKNAKPIYLFGVNSTDKAKNATISMLFFQRENIQFIGAVVPDELDNLTTKDRRNIISASDKIFYNLADFQKNGQLYFNRTFET